MSSEINKLSHVGINGFVEWAKIRVEDNPEVVVKIEPDTKGYDELKLDRRPPPKIRDTETSALVDTGAQMVVMGLRTVYQMGLGKKHIIPVGMTIKAANTGGLKLLGGVLVRIRGSNRQGKEIVTRQLAYIAEEVERVFISKKAAEDLGIINKEFPTIGAFKPESGEIDAITDDFIINDSKACQGLDSGKCACPKRELPPTAPTACPYPPTVENMDRLKT